VPEEPTIEELKQEIASLKKLLDMCGTQDEKYLEAHKYLGGIQNRQIAKLVEASASASSALREAAAGLVEIAKNLAAERVKHPRLTGKQAERQKKRERDGETFSANWPNDKA